MTDEREECAATLLDFAPHTMDRSVRFRMEQAARLLRSPGPLDSLERAVVDTAMARLAQWRKKNSEEDINLPPDSAALKLIEACIALEKARLAATAHEVKP